LPDVGKIPISQWRKYRTIESGQVRNCGATNCIAAATRSICTSCTGPIANIGDSTVLKVSPFIDTVKNWTDISRNSSPAVRNIKGEFMKVVDGEDMDGLGCIFISKSKEQYVAFTSSLPIHQIIGADLDKIFR
jgi:hypothetical protein